MNFRTRILSAGLAVAASAGTILIAQEIVPSQTRTTRTTMQQNADGSTTTNTTTTTVTGDVVSYEPGKTIVVRDANRGPITYTLGPSLTVPADVQVGRRVTIMSDPVDGSLRVSRITTVTSSSSSKTAATAGSGPADATQTTMTTQSTQSNPPAGSDANPQTTTRTTKTTRTTTVAGTVQAYEPGQSITIVGPGSKTTTYVVTSDSHLPQDVAVGKVVTVQTSMVSGKAVAQTVTYKTTTKTTQTKTISPR